MPTLFSYRITHDTGAAPNPFWGVCTLVICKPAIRRAAIVGDWIVGTGSARSPKGDISDRVVYAMKVTRKMTMREYDLFTQESLPDKIPIWSGYDPRRKAGDSIYDFSHDPPAMRKSVHNESTRQRDLGGENALLSDHYWYFGDWPRRLPPDLRALAPPGQGHRSSANAPYLEAFLIWLDGLGLEPNRLHGEPQERPALACTPQQQRRPSCIGRRRASPR